MPEQTEEIDRGSVHEAITDEAEFRLSGAEIKLTYEINVAGTLEEVAERNDIEPEELNAAFDPERAGRHIQSRGEMVARIAAINMFERDVGISLSTSPDHVTVRPHPTKFGGMDDNWLEATVNFSGTTGIDRNQFESK